MNITPDLLLSTWLPFVVAGLIQASFGLGVSVLTLLSGHSLYKKRTTAGLLSLSGAYIWGVIFATGGLLFSAVYCLTAWNVDSQLLWAILAGLGVGIGLVVMLFYYRRGRGTMLWLPRSMAEFLYDRTKKTKNTFEAFLLGVGSIVAELIFIIAPLLIAANVLAGQPDWARLGGIVLYVLIAIVPLVVMFFAIAGGHKISRLQAWREKNKTFLQVAAGAGLIVLAIYVYVYHVLGVLS